MYYKATHNNVALEEWMRLNFDCIPTAAFELCDPEGEAERIWPPRECPTCNGTGDENLGKPGEPEWFECSDCDGEGTVSGPDEDECLYAYPFAWGHMWSPHVTPTDEEREAMLACGFLLYEHPVFGLVAGIDGAGYSFHDEHWAPLRVKACEVIARAQGESA